MLTISITIRIDLQMVFHSSIIMIMKGKGMKGMKDIREKKFSRSIFGYKNSRIEREISD